MTSTITPGSFGRRTNKVALRLCVVGLLASSLNNVCVVAFSFQTGGFQQLQQQRCIDTQETAQRDIYTLQQWAPSVGIQSLDGLQLMQTPINQYTNLDGQDASMVYTGQQMLPKGTTLMQVPQNLCFCSTKLGKELGGNLEATENALNQFPEAAERLPLFRLMVKVLTEVEQGQSNYQPWLNSLPRRFYNGVAMTQDCFECLPPYASYLSRKERDTFTSFASVLRNGYLELSQETMNDDALIQWAYNIALTRHQKVLSQNGQIEKKIAPFVDMINHSASPNAAIQYDLMGNCRVVTTTDVAPNSEILVSYGDSVNPTPIFAQFGFLVDDAPSIFCKAVHLQPQITALGLEHGRLLFDVSTGEVSSQVWDLFLYSLLLENNEVENAQAFHTACATRDESTKQAYHGHYFAYTLNSLKQFVDGTINEIDMLSNKASSYDAYTHPRVPMILAHNDLVKSTFQKVQGNLNVMG